jgi:hypothetical protein
LSFLVNQSSFIIKVSAITVPGSIVSVALLVT